MPPHDPRRRREDGGAALIRTLVEHLPMDKEELPTLTPLAPLLFSPRTLAGVHAYTMLTCYANLEGRAPDNCQASARNPWQVLRL